MNSRDQFVLLIGGPSGAGKTTAAEEIGRQLSIPWLMVDDLRLALQRSQVTLPVGTDALYFFADIEDPKERSLWQESPERLRDALIAVGEVMAPAIEAVILNHLSQRHPVIIEGDGILPSVLTRSLLQEPRLAGHLHAVFVVESDEEALLHNMLARGRGMDIMTMADAQTEAHAKALFSQWITKEAQSHGLPVIESRPWDTLVERVLAATASAD
jgi:2-phosphoglycerate kinase